MATHPPPIVNPLDCVDKLGTADRIGYLTLDKERVKAYVMHLEKEYNSLIPNPEEAPPNKWAGYAKAIVMAMKMNFLVKEEDHKFLEANMGYLYHQVVTDHMADLRSRYTVASREFERNEIFGVQKYLPDQECVHCKVGHQTVGGPTECNFSYGPYDVELLKGSAMSLENTLAMMVGTGSFLTLHESSWNVFLNVGIPNKERLHLIKGKDLGIVEEVQNRIQLLDKDSVMPILVEFHHDILSPLSVPAQLFGYVCTLAKVQRKYKGPIVLIIPPHHPGSWEGFDEYQAKKNRHLIWEKMGSLLGQMWGLAVCSFPIQTEGKDVDTVMSHPNWAVEPLFNEDRQCTREYHRRVYEHMACLVDALQPWIVTVANRQNCLKFKPDINRLLEETWSNIHIPGTWFPTMWMDSQGRCVRRST